VDKVILSRVGWVTWLIIRKCLFNALFLGVSLAELQLFTLQLYNI
jgi:hypothetical protein